MIKGIIRMPSKRFFDEKRQQAGMPKMTYWRRQALLKKAEENKRWIEKVLERR